MGFRMLMPRHFSRTRLVTFQNCFLQGLSKVNYVCHAKTRSKSNYQYSFFSSATDLADDDIYNVQRLNENRWKHTFEKYKRYAERMKQEKIIGENDLLPYPTDRILQRFVDYNRRQFHLKSHGLEHSLTEERQKLLESVGFSLTPRQDFWEKRYNELCEFIERRGCFPYDLPEEDLDDEEKRLFYWCQQQKKAYRSYKDGDGAGSSITEERIRKLNDINFVFNTFTTTWMTRYEELKEYYNHHGDCMVPVDYPANQSLSVWVGEQRYHYKKMKEGRSSSMTPERLALLKELDFEWNAIEARWMQKYEELKEFMRVNGIGVVPTMKQNRALSSWVKYQRKQYTKYMEGRKSSHTTKRKALLDALHFPW